VRDTGARSRDVDLIADADAEPGIHVWEIVWNPQFLPED
jgi:hypothetical protein